MARVTVEDCVVKIPNRFDLVMLAAQRARDISSGTQLTVERDNDKNPVVALREIADETVEIEELAESLIQSLQRHVQVDEPEDDVPEFDLPTLESELAAAGEMPPIRPEALAVPGDAAAEGTDGGTIEGDAAAAAPADAEAAPAAPASDDEIG